MKLLIVENSSAIYGRLLTMLGGVEHLTALSIARSLQEADEKSRNFCPEAAVLDINLPDGNGLDALRAIKRNCPNTQVFMFTNQVEFRDTARQAGADGFYDKSMEFEALVARLLGYQAIPELHEENAA